MTFDIITGKADRQAKWAKKFAEAVQPAPATQPVGVAQAHLPLGSQWQESFYGRNLLAYLSLCLALSSGSPLFLSWSSPLHTSFFLSPWSGRFCC